MEYLKRNEVAKTDFQTLRRRDTEVFLFTNTKCAKETKAFVYSVSSVFMFILTTDIQDLTDTNHERKRDNPFNL